MKNLIRKINEISIIKRIAIGLFAGIILGLLIPNQAKPIAIFGDLFTGALKSIAPVLVLFLVMSTISRQKSGQKSNMKTVIILYLFSTFTGGFFGVLASFMFPTKLTLVAGVQALTPPEGIAEVLKTILLNLVDNPVNAITRANYVGILVWGMGLGLALRGASESTKTMISNISDALTKVVGWIIDFAPLGIMGLVFSAISTNGLEVFVSYGKLLAVLVGTMLFLAFVLNPIIVFLNIRQNPYPLIFTCLKEAGLTAFFTRSSAATIPVNMELCKKLGLDKETYSVSIPLGATINTSGASVVISVLTLAAAHTVGIQVDLPTAVILSLLATVAACGCAGIAGGSLLLVPLACSLFGIPNDIAMQVVAVGFVISFIQDSVETAINASTDVLFTATAEFAERRKAGKEIIYYKKEA
jgi:serine/threonine transporter